MKLHEILSHLNRLAPLELAAEWDNVGLLLGDPSSAVERVLTCLTVTPAVVDEAIAEKAQLVITHHPILFRPVKRLSADTTEGRMLLAMARAGIAVYSAHTAYDNAPGGINDLLASRLNLLEVGPLQPRTRQEVKLVVFTPEKDLACVSDALFAAGAGFIGQYRECSFRISGTGTFFATEGTNPTVGQKGRREDVSEWRLEVVCPRARLPTVLSAMRKAHSYEEPAYDLYPLQPAPDRIGTGRIGRLPRPLSLRELTSLVRSELKAPGTQYVGDPEQMVGRVGIVCGAGGELLQAAMQAGAEVFLTGEMRFHDCLAAQAGGTSVILPGHFATEHFAMQELASRLQADFPPLHIWSARAEVDPLQA